MMLTFMIILIVILTIALLIVTSFRPVHCEYSKFELERRIVEGDKIASKLLKREERLVDVVSLQNVVSAVLLVVISFLLIGAFGWFTGALLSLLLALEYRTIARVNGLRQISSKTFEKIEKPLLRFIKKYPLVFAVFRNSDSPEATRRIGSCAELQHLIDGSSEVLTSEDKALVVRSLGFSSQLISSVMTPKDKIVSVKKGDFLGPLALDDLYHLGHTKMPVISGGLNHIVGILNIDDLLSLDDKKSVTVEKVMDHKVHYLQLNQTLRDALEACVENKQTFFVVVNESKETVGLITIADIVGALLKKPETEYPEELSGLHIVSEHRQDV